MSLIRWDSVVEDHIEEGTVDTQTTVVVDEAELAELMQKETHPGPRRADYLGQRFLTDPRQHQLLFRLCQSGPATRAPTPTAEPPHRVCGTARIALVPTAMLLLEFLHQCAVLHSNRPGVALPSRGLCSTRHTCMQRVATQCCSGVNVLIRLCGHCRAARHLAPRNPALRGA
jgi:hypothetical protein